MEELVKRKRGIFKQIDLTVGTPWKVILAFFVPIFITQLLGNAFSLINSLVLKVTVGGDSVAAINATGSLSTILFQFAYGCSNGFAVIAANKYGKKDYAGVHNEFYNSIFLSLLIGSFITIIGLIFYDDLLLLLNVNEIYLSYSKAYFQIILYGFLTMLLSNLLNNFLNALGDSSASLVINTTGTIVNIALAFLFTGAIKLNTRGVAIATILSNIYKTVIFFVYIYKKYPYLRIKAQKIQIEKKICFDMLKLGVPLGLQWSILFIGSFFQSRTVNSFGNGLATKAGSCYGPIETYITMPLSSLSSAFLSYVGQNYGIMDKERIKKGLKQMLVLDLIFYAIVLVIGLAIKNYAPYIFLPKSEVDDPINGPLIKYYTYTYLNIIIPSVILQGILTLSRSVLQGLMKPLIPFISGIGELAARIAVCAFLPSIINASNPLSDESYIGVCFSNPAAWFMSTLIMGGSAFYIIFIKNMNLNKEKKS